MSDTDGSQRFVPDWEDFTELELPLAEIPARTELFRIHSTGDSPFSFARNETTPGYEPRHRFDDPCGRYGVMYVSHQRVGAFAETISRQFFEQDLSEPKILYWSRYHDRVLTRITIEEPMRVVDLTDDAVLARLGVDIGLMGGDDYEWTRKWSCLFHHHGREPDGIRYRARHASSTKSIAVFHRFDESNFKREESVSLTRTETPEQILEYLNDAGFTLR